MRDPTFPEKRNSLTKKIRRPPICKNAFLAETRKMGVMKPRRVRFRDAECKVRDIQNYPLKKKHCSPDLNNSHIGEPDNTQKSIGKCKMKYTGFHQTSIMDDTGDN